MFAVVTWKDCDGLQEKWFEGRNAKINADSMALTLASLGIKASILVHALVGSKY